MNHQLFHPPAHLKKWVRFFWTLDCTATESSPFTLKTFACRYPRIIFQHQDGHSAISHQTQLLPLSFFSGLHSRPETLTFKNSFSLTGVSFFPHAIKTIFRIDCHEPLDRFVDLNDLAPKWSEERLLHTADQHDRVDIIAKFISSLLLKNGEQDLLTMKSVCHINNHSRCEAIKHLQDYYNISERQLERRFKKYVGFSPKQYLRITRFEKSIERILAHDFTNLSDIAYDLGFYDQTHFIQDFKEFSGYTPLAFFKQSKQLEETSSMFVE